VKFIFINLDKNTNSSGHPDVQLPVGESGPSYLIDAFLEEHFFLLKNDAINFFSVVIPGPMTVT
jgi:hypothetical protein